MTEVFVDVISKALHSMCVSLHISESYLIYFLITNMPINS